MQQIVIIGNGIGGVTTARHIRKNSDVEILIISGETEHFFSRTALMYVYMGHMKYENTKPYEDWFWEKNNIQLKQAWVEKVLFEEKALILKSGERVSYDKLILATGSTPNKFGWKGENLMGVQGFYSFQDLELMEDNTWEIDNAVIIGGGLIGVEMAEMLHSKGIHVTHLVREKYFWGSVLPKEQAQLINEHIRKHGIDLRTETELEEVIGNEINRVKAVKTKEKEEIQTEFVGLAVGVHPNIEFLKDSELKIDRGIVVDEYLQTNIPNVYAIGDCAQLKKPQEGRRSIEAVWYVGRMMGETVAQTITGNPTKYQPGVWFNSAKFFDLEYQTYGTVLAKPDENTDFFFWVNDEFNKSIYITFDKITKEVKGVNFIGIRSRHEVWNNWIIDKKRLCEVIEKLPKANFDPEFFKRYETEIQDKYNRDFPENPVKISKKTFLQKLFS